MNRNRMTDNVYGFEPEQICKVRKTYFQNKWVLPQWKISFRLNSSEQLWIALVGSHPYLRRLLVIFNNCSLDTVVGNLFKMASLTGCHERQMKLNCLFMFSIPKISYYFIISIVISLVRYYLLFILHHTAGLQVMHLFDLYLPHTYMLAGCYTVSVVSSPAYCQKHSLPW
jgi:hypothetical protein